MRRMLLAAVCTVYAAVVLSPFEWSPPSWVENGAEEIPGGWRFHRPGIVRGPAPRGDVDLRVRVRPATVEQMGAPRILTVSHDTSRRNLTLAQERGDLLLYLRSHETNANASPRHRVRGVLSPGRWVDLRLMVRGCEAVLLVDGLIRFEKQYKSPPMESWNRGFQLAIGNEHSGNRPWLGEVEYAGVVDRPAGFWRTNYYVPRLVPFRDSLGGDMLKNLLGFVPFGIAVALLGWSVRGVVGLAAALSAFLELAQLGLAARCASTTDLLLNVLGAFTGALIVRRLLRDPRGSSPPFSRPWRTSRPPAP